MKQKLIPRPEKKVNCMDYISTREYKVHYWEIMKNRM